MGRDKFVDRRTKNPASPADNKQKQPKTLVLMKNALKALVFFLLLVLAHQATAQKREPLQSWKDEFKYQFMHWVLDKDSVEAGQLADKLMAMSASEKFNYFRDNVVVSDKIKVAKAEVINFTYGSPQLLTVNNAVMPIAFLRVGKIAEFGSDYGDVLFPMYTYKGKPDALDYNPDLMAGYDFNGDGTPDDAKYDAVTKNVVPSINAPIPQNSSIAGVTPNGGGAAGMPGVTILPDSTIIGPGFMVTSQGVTLIQQANGMYVPANQLQGGGQTAQAPAPKADSTLRTASYSVNVAQSGDPNLLASNGGFGQQSKQAVGGQLPSTVYDVDPSKTFYQYNQATGLIEPVEKSLPPYSVVDPGTNGVILDSKGKMTRDNNRIMKMRIRHGYDEFGNPTDATIEKMKSKNRVWGGLGVGWITMQQPGYYNVVPVNNGCNGCYQHPNSFGPVACGSSLWGFR